MRTLKPLVKLACVTLILLFGLSVVAVWHFQKAHRIATIELGKHQLRLTIVYHFDVSRDVLCELRGPSWNHPPEIIAFIGAGETVPGFTPYQSQDREMFWITANTMPKTILYALDVKTGEHWPDRESCTVGDKFLEVANDGDEGYRLYQYEWIGVKE